MPLRDDLEDEPETMEYWQFPECGGCANRMKPRTCRACDNGEFFEEAEPEGLDSIFR